MLPKPGILLRMAMTCSEARLPKALGKAASPGMPGGAWEPGGGCGGAGAPVGAREGSWLGGGAVAIVSPIGSQRRVLGWPKSMSRGKIDI